jgi:hypothetical protein
MFVIKKATGEVVEANRVYNNHTSFQYLAMWLRNGGSTFDVMRCDNDICGVRFKDFLDQSTYTLLFGWIVKEGPEHFVPVSNRIFNQLYEHID